jgi:hypothetical protein
LVCFVILSGTWHGWNVSLEVQKHPFRLLLESRKSFYTSFCAF